MKVIRKKLLPLLVVLANFFIQSLAANARTTTKITMDDLGILGGANPSYAFDISDDGLIVVGYNKLNIITKATIINGIELKEILTAERAFKYESGMMTEIGTLESGNISTAYAISGDGSTIVGYRCYFRRIIFSRLWSFWRRLNNCW